jgi:hypothetical protein
VGLALCDVPWATARRFGWHSVAIVCTRFDFFLSNGGKKYQDPVFLGKIPQSVRNGGSDRSATRGATLGSGCDSLIAGDLAAASPARKARRLRNGLCIRCGYDIRACPDRLSGMRCAIMQPHVQSV